MPESVWGVRRGLTAVILAAATLATATAAAQEAPRKKPRTVREIMRSLREHAEPGEPHRKLEPLIGSWRTEGLYWLSPSSRPIEFKGSSKSEWMLGRRFVRTAFKTDIEILDYPNEGVSIEGYDNSTGKYVVSRFEAYSTSIMRLEGACRDDCRHMEWRSQVLDPSTYQEVSVRVVRSFLDADRYRLEVFLKRPDREEFLQTRLTATRLSP